VVAKEDRLNKDTTQLSMWQEIERLRAQNKELVEQRIEKHPM
jgi:hypothetical protein